jgi:gas vesicle protein
LPFSELFKDYNKEVRDYKDLRQDFEENQMVVFVGKYDLLVKEYQELLHKSDFENLDYIIYLFATGRAEKMMDALRLLDDERRNQRLVASVESSAEYVISNIGQIVDRLGRQLDMAISELGDRIENAVDHLGNRVVNAVHYSTDRMVSAINSNSKKIMSSLNALKSASDAQKRSIDNVRSDIKKFAPN